MVGIYLVRLASQGRGNPSFYYIEGGLEARLPTPAQGQLISTRYVEVDKPQYQKIVRAKNKGVLLRRLWEKEIEDMFKI